MNLFLQSCHIKAYANKKQLKEIESGKNLEEIKENSSEHKKFKRVALGGERGI